MTSQEPQEEVDPEDSGNRSEKSHMGISEIPDLWGPCIQVCGSCGFKSALPRGSPAQHQTCHCFFFVKTVQRPQSIWQDTNFADLLSFISTCLSARTWSEVLLPCPSSLLLTVEPAGDKMYRDAWSMAECFTSVKHTPRTHAKPFLQVVSGHQRVAKPLPSLPYQRQTKISSESIHLTQAVWFPIYSRFYQSTHQDKEVPSLLA